MEPGKPHTAPLLTPSKGSGLVQGIGTTVMLFGSMFLVPFVGVFLSSLTPLPTIVGCYRWGRPMGYVVPGGAAVLLGPVLLLLGWGQWLVYLVELLLLGVLLGDGMRRGTTVGRLVGRSAAVVFGLWVVLFLITGGGWSTDTIKQLEEYFLAAARTILESGVLPQEVRINEQALKELVPVFVRVLPGFALSSSLLLGWLNLLAAKRWCQVRRVPLPSWGDWSRWKAPEPLVWGVVGCGFLLLVPSPALKSVSMNALIILATVYLFQGLAIVAFFFHRWSLAWPLRGILYALIFLSQFARLGVVTLGFFDVWLDLRSRAERARAEPNEE